MNEFYEIKDSKEFVAIYFDGYSTNDPNIIQDVLKNINNYKDIILITRQMAQFMCGLDLGHQWEVYAKSKDYFLFE